MGDSILWYIREHRGTVTGPFSVSIINNQLSLQRLKTNDEVSTDQINWRPLSRWPELQKTHSENTVKQLDERNGFDRRDKQQSYDSPTQRSDNERRTLESDEDIHRRQSRTQLMQKFRQRKQPFFWPTFILISLSLLVLFIGVFYAESFPTSLSSCDKAAAPHINWENCLKPKINLENKDLSNAQLRNSQLSESNLMNTKLNSANLSYADLHASNLSYSQMKNTNLKGANLKNADLSYADLSNSDLSYADLSQANLGGSKLNNVRFDHAIWIDGQVCTEQSIGQCN
ncbi:MAG: pentapeptide repeat-containing protein [Methylophaga sp.]|nr:pentapeptide repeat-containing protein [Methylophaga sp.]